MSTIMAASGESRWGQSCFETAARISGKYGWPWVCLGDVLPHIAENSGGSDLRGPGQCLLPLPRAMCCPRVAYVLGYGCRSGRA